MNNTFKLTIHMVASLDGIIAKPDNGTAWFDTADHYEQGATLTDEDAAAFLKSIDCYIMGSHTYEHALELSKQYGWAYGDTPTRVLTKRTLPVERPNVELYNGDLNELIANKLKPNYQNVWMAGGPTLAKELIRQKLADEIRLSIIPIILGEGKQFFDHVGLEQPLHLKDIKAYKNGMVELCYEVVK